ncbi:class I SAM-dependent methyltransferase [Amycolatopsis sp. YIM 10]|uniref:class I SAM-dependent DNA methyltransferase n=1 Tax=Amycolatopsis sp. YIM 10 TaxID=2653857 RepID=UPI001290250B|nr:class I SAM-dependent methyltransferase [Amycolatopsis sp. YIM 10]QFU90568.1 Cypemycin methyltransferase [Amycolatopsis sp. YIM 10]
MAVLEEYGPETYGDRLAEIYDDWVVGLQDDAAEATEFLTGLAKRTAAETGVERVLELGVGTGRIALPLAEAGLDVTGVDASEAMLDRLRAKPGGSGVRLVRGDFAELEVAGPFGLTYVVFNTICCLTSQEEQIRCFEAVAQRLAPGGAFVVQAFVPDAARYELGKRSRQRMEVARDGEEVLQLGIPGHDPDGQLLSSQYVMQTPERAIEYSIHIRYASPAELDLMARLAGLRREHRWGSWSGAPLTAESPWHVSVYRKDDA